VYELFRQYGADIWVEKDAKDILPQGTVCEKCGNNTFTKESDILDVGFDSGVSHAAVLEQRPYLKWPADLYLEGSDQHRGWFHSALLTAVGTRGKAPYDAVLTHGFVVDEQGRKMSKSVGNVIAPAEIINEYGAEVLRLWVSASDYRDDIRISKNILKQLSDAYRKIRNTCRFMLGNLYDFDPEKHSFPYNAMPEIDKFALHNLARLIAKGNKAYGDYEFHVIYHSLYNYCTIDLSALYLDILKDRLYTSPPASPERRSAQTVMYNILDSIIRLMAPLLPFTAEEVWKYMPGKKQESIHFELLPVPDDKWENPELAKKWETLLDIRGEVTKALEQARAKKQIGHSLEAAVTISAEPDTYALLNSYADELKIIFIVSDVSVVQGQKQADDFESETIKGLSVHVELAKGGKCERCWMHDHSVGTISDHPAICKRCYDNLEK
jgi:isoleucyl-tRNA synthetase